MINPFPKSSTDLDFQKIFESAPVRCLVLQPDLTIVAVTDEYLHAMMVSRASLIGNNLLHVLFNNKIEASIVADWVASIRTAIDNKITDSMPLQSFNICYPESTRMVNAKNWSQVNSPVLDENGEVLYIIHCLEETTKLPQVNAPIDTKPDMEQKLRAAEEALQQANKELEAFSYSVSHDLRAPLRSIDGFSQIFEENYSSNIPDDAKHFLKRIRESASEMGRLIDDLLAFSRLSRQAINKQDVLIYDLAKSIADKLVNAEIARKIEVNIDNLPPCYADENLLRQVLANLLSNSLKFTRPVEKAKIEIGFQSRNGESVYFVKDNGVGFDMRYVDKLFKVFQRLHKVDEFNGTGIGLAIVDRVIRRHGGRVWCEGEIGKGAIFYFTIGDKHDSNSAL